MTPAARVAAAIELLDQVIGGAPAEKTLTRWARANRYAGSKDRVAIRDHVFDALRCLKSFAAQGGAKSGAETGRAVMIGALRAQSIDPASFFTGEGYAPAALSEPEQEFVPDTPDELTELDCPSWLAPQLRASLGADFAPVMSALRQRAPVFLRVNRVKSDVPGAMAALESEGIVARPHSLSPNALEVIENARRIRASRAYLDGLVELQDAGSQAIIDQIEITGDMRILDYCSGGGGKSLALAGRGAKNLFAHDINPARLRDLPKRAERAQALVQILSNEEVQNAAPFDLVLADVPCSGSGTWRRAPDEKWRLSAEKLDELCAVQAGILDEISARVRPGGSIAYVTCSLLECENEAQTDAFLRRHGEWELTVKTRLNPLDGGDGFYLALLRR